MAGKIQRTDNDFLRPLGKKLTYLDLKTIISDVQTELAGYKQIEANARSVFNEFKNVAERLQSGIYRYDVKSKRFLFFNRSAIKLLGSKVAVAADITSKSILTRIHPADRGMVRHRARDSMCSTSGRGDAEYRFRKNDGTYRWNYDRWVVLRDSSDNPRYIEGIVMDITDRKLTEEALKESQTRLRILSSHLLEAQEKERRRIAMELHDEFGQALMVLKLRVRSIGKGLPTNEETALKACKDTNKYVDRIIANVRKLSHELLPSCLEDLGLDESISMLAEEYAKLTGLDVRLEAHDIDSIFDRESKILIYRIFQEAFTNIHKHANATKIWISIKRQRNKKMVEIDIAENGKGFVSNKNSFDARYRKGPGLGLTAMQERARMLGGSMQIFSIIGIGTRLAFSIPHKQKRSYDGFVSYSVG